MTEPMRDGEYRELLARSLTTIDELETKLAALERSQHEPIAIVGIGCRLPGGADDPESFWRLLQEGVDAVGEVPPERWDVEATYDPRPGTPGRSYTRWGGFVGDVSAFDPQFFGISPREAVSIDPQQRLLLEVAWEALERAGKAPAALAGSRTGVFVGLVGNDYALLQTTRGELDRIDGFYATGLSHSVAAGRISYTLGLAGPSLAVDTACSSSLVAAHLACQSLRGGECDLALAGGVNLVLVADGNVVTSQARMMSPQGRCKAFAADADGYVRGEGCGVVVLKRLADALADGDDVLAVIEGTAVNQDGRSNGLAAPSGPAQEAVIGAALADAGVAAGDVEYVEAHGTGTSLGDPIEIGALAATYCAGRPAERPLLVGSVKTNVGHLEGAAGIAGLIKAVLALREGIVPPHLHFRQPSPHIPWETISLAVPTEAAEWPAKEGGRRRAAVSSFGFSGTNAHMILAEPPSLPAREPSEEPCPQLLPLSARTPAALDESARRLERFLAGTGEPLADVAFTAGTGRSHFEERLALVAGSTEQARERLAAWLLAGEAAGVRRASTSGERPPELAFLFTGQGAQYAGMGRGLYEGEPLFRSVLERCDRILRDELERPLLSVLYPDGGEHSPIDDTAYAQPALFALEYALAELWRSWGVRPAAVAGHSLGEYVAACVAGVFTLEDGLRLVAARGRLMSALPSGGAMAAVFAGEATVAAAVGPLSDTLSIAAVNGPEEVVVSGAADALGTLLGTLAEQGITARELTVSHAFHSPLVEPMLQSFEEVAATVSYRPPELALVSALGGELAGDEVTAASFWRRHAREPVRFGAAVLELHAQGFQTFVEIGPSPTLSGLGERCLPDAGCVWLPSLRRGREEREQMLESLGSLYTAGVAVDWNGLHRGRPRRSVALPTYPFQRQRYWLDLGDGPAVSGRSDVGHPLLGRRVSAALPTFEAELSLDALPALDDHRIGGLALVAMAALAEMALAAAAEALPAGAGTLRNLVVREPLIVPESGSVTVQLALVPDEGGGASFQIFSRRRGAPGAGNGASPEGAWRLHASGTIEAGVGEKPEPPPVSIAEERAGLADALDAGEFYERLADVGADYGPSYRALTAIWRRHGEALGRLELPEADMKGYVLQPALVDACLQLVGATMPGAERSGREADEIYVPVRIDRLRRLGTPTARGWCKASLRPREDGAPLVADALMLDDEGRAVAELGGLEFHRLDRAARRAGEPELSEWLYELEWHEGPRMGEASDSGSRTWLLLADSGGLGAALVGLLEGRGDRCLLVEPGESFEQTGERSWRLDPTSQADFRQLLDDARALAGPPLRGVVHLWSLREASRHECSAEALQAAAELGCGAALQLVQALAASVEIGAGSPRLWLVTRGSQSAPGTPEPSAAQSPLWGLARVVALEHPRLRCHRIDLDPRGSAGEELDVLLELVEPDDEDQVSFRAGRRYVARLVRSPAEAAQRAETKAEPPPVRLEVAARGTLDGLRTSPATRRSPGHGEIELRVQASGLNFRDVLNVLGMYPGDPGALGSECAGVVSAVGEGVRGLAVGDEVVALAPGAFASFVTTRSELVAPVPAGLRFEEAATLPIAFLTAEYGLGRLARLSAGERVLVHAAAGGVGLAAVQIALAAGAEVFATAGSPEKRAYLRSLGVPHVMDSRSLAFADEVASATGGEGVHVVLNSLAGEFIPASVSVLAEEGRFLEIGKRGIWDARQLAECKPRALYFPYDLAQVFSEDPGLARSMLRALVEAVEAKRVRPLPLRVFPLEHAVDAFGTMARARHIGKVVLVPSGRLPAVPPPAARPRGDDDDLLAADATYIVTGGLGALGLAVAKAMASWGARRLVLVGRSDPAPGARAVLEDLERAGVEVRPARADVSRRDDVEDLLAAVDPRAPLRGVVHAAGVLDDGALVNQTWERFAAVMAPKVAGAWNLHELTREAPLELFVLFSSGASLLGNAGQGSYAAANAFLDGLAHLRRAQGLPVLSVNWGPWAGAGMAAPREDRKERWGRLGMRMIPPEDGVAALELLLRRPAGAAQVAVMRVDWSRLGRRLDAGTPPLLSQLVTPPRGRPERERPRVEPGDFRQQLEAAADEGERNALVEEEVRAQAAAVLALEPAAIDADRSFTELGMDSLLAVELANRLQASLGGSFPSTLAFEHPSVAALSEHLVATVFGEASAAAKSVVGIERRGAGPAPLSAAQQRMWFLDQMEPGSSTYNIAVTARLSGQLDVPTLERSLAAIVDRHEILRTTYAAPDGRPVQVVSAEANVALAVVELGHLPEPARDAELERLRTAEAQRPFDLAGELPIRASLLRLDAEDHVLLLTMHHIASDGWSVGVIARELAVIYPALLAGEPHPLPELRAQYADFATWEQQLPAGETAAELAYWREQLRDLPVVELRPDFPRPLVQTYRGARRSLLLPAERARALVELARAEDATTFMALLTGLNVLLSRHANSTDVVVGSPIAGRSRPELEGLVGFFVNTLVLRTDLSGRPSFRETLRRVRETCLEAYANQALSFERLLEELRPARDLSRTPLFQVFLNMLSFGRGFAELPGIEGQLEFLAEPEPGAKFDLTIYAAEDGAGLHLTAVYNADLYRPERIKELLDQLGVLLEQALAHPDAPVDELSLVTSRAAERLPDPTGTLARPSATPVPATVAERARHAPGRPALADAAGTWTFGELERRSNQLAHLLLASGLEPEDVVAVHGGRRAALVTAMLGVLKAGGAFLLLDPTHPAPHLARYVRAAGVRGWLELDGAPPLPADLDEAVSELPLRIRARLPLEAGDPGALAEQPDSDPNVRLRPESLAYVAFTSGTTGEPKGVLGEHGPLAHFLDWHLSTFGLGADDRFSMLSGIGHDPLLRDVFAPLAAGATLCIPDPESLTSGGDIRRWLAEQRITVAHLTPALGQVLTQDADGMIRLPSLRYAFFGGDVLPRSLTDAFRRLAPAARSVNFYGATETPQGVGHHLIDSTEARTGAFHPIGKGITDVQLLVLTPAGAPAGVGEVGEIHVRSPFLARGYLGDEALTRARFLPSPITGSTTDRVYRTGDLGCYALDGSVEFLGRGDRQLNVLGFRVQPEEVETALRRHPAVRDAAVVAGAIEQVLDGGAASTPVLTAYVALDPDTAPDATELRRFLAGQLPGYMVPGIVVPLEAVPRTPNGKLDLAALPERRAAAAAGSFDPPAGPLEELVAGIWRDVLEVERVSASDNFFDLGGQSLATMRVVSGLERELGVRISPRELVYSTLRQFAALCEAELGAGRSNGGSGLRGRIRSLRAGGPKAAR